MTSQTRLVSSCLLFALTPAVVALAAGETPPPAVSELESGWAALGDSTAGLSATRHKSGDTALRWTWKDASGALELRSAAFTADARGGFGFWIHHAKPAAGMLRGELLRGGTVVGAFRIRLDFSGWRPVVVAYRDAGFSGGGAPDALRIHAPETAGEVHVDAARFDLLPRDQGGADAPFPPVLPESVVRFGVAGGPPVRPWLPTAGAVITPQDRADLAAVAARLLPPEEKPRGGLKDAELAAIRSRVAEYRVRRDDGRVTGRAVVPDLTERFWPGSVTLRPADGVPISDYLGFCDEVRRAYGRARNDREATELAGLFTDLCAHLIDQGWVPGGEALWFANYPCKGRDAFLPMRGVLAQAGLDRDIGLFLAWNYGAHGPGGYLEEKPFASMDGLGFWCSSLPGYLQLLPDEAERLWHLRAATRLYNLTLTDSRTLGPDGAPYHHNAFHFAYASYNLPRLVTTLKALARTGLFIDRAAHERLRTYARAMAFTFSGGEQPYNLAARAGTPLHGDMGRFAAELAEFGPPERSPGYDREMAALSLSQIAEQGEAGRALAAKAPWAGWIADGVTPAVLSGHVALNAGPVAVHRRPGWLVGIGGQGAFAPGLEIYGWTLQNNYGRFARHGSVCLMATGEPPALAASGWSPEGWNWAHFPGATTLRLGSRELFEGYLETANRNPRCGGAALDGDGVWGMDADINHEWVLPWWKAGLPFKPVVKPDVRFRKSVFCFDDRITVLTTDIAGDDGAPAVTTLFQNTLRSAGEAVLTDDGLSVTAPAERTLAAGPGRWLLDNRGAGYLLHDGAAVRLRSGRQSWLYMTSKYLRDPKTEPFGPKLGLAYRDWTPEGKDLGALERLYKPSEGDFALAYFDHGVKPAAASCAYTLVVRATPARLAALTRVSPVVFLSREGGRHAVRDVVSGAEAYSWFEAGDNPGAGLLRSVNLPIFALIKPEAGTLKVSVASTDLKRPGPVVLRVRGAWKAAAGFPVVTTPAGADTRVELRPEHYQAAQFRLAPAR